MKIYALNSVFVSLQGEGLRTGTVNVFVRFAGCNRTCPFCDTDFKKLFTMSAGELIYGIRDIWSSGEFPPAVILTGGEPMLQVDMPLLEEMKAAGFYVAIETNGTLPVPSLVDWITVSPKDGIPMQLVANEVKFVMQKDSPLPTNFVETDNLLLSPVHRGERIDEAALAWCISLCIKNPQWRLSTQAHKAWGIA